ncbi:ATP-binding cassette domain-containing protein [Candidatus Phytoplasma australiense]|uniref:Cobalt import ATP-binding protein cbiO 2 n=1 Tax=Strawberry lethal yellows phytoplasma (CPA) str. NZSb11 TaxID=980422 RepID=R4RXM3_PHYAS|nr:ATP-binding cassette domain-containing protein [Candidatus Phytoplasma australiense]AGL90652.1 Cobalt import ATP-binding protein cbiO 2 [Strawberry lethal yellows phytoplasma (CPA) str. NZSb11]
MGIQFEKVNFFYPKNNQNQTVLALNNINLKIAAKNEFIALVGKTGSGKSTLVQLMNALLTTNNGKITIFNQNINNQTNKNLLTALRKKVGLVFQFPEYQLFEATILKDVMFGPENFFKNKEIAHQKAKEALKHIGIKTDLYLKSPFQISDGQQRKVALAGIIAMEPDILILDEPTRGLDAISKTSIMRFLNDLNVVFEKSIILITHDMNLVAQYAKRVIALDKGEILFDGQTKAFFENPEFHRFNLDFPETFKILQHLNKTLGIPFKPQYCFPDLLKYLKKFYD